MFGSFVKKVAGDQYQFDGMSYRDVYIFLGKDIAFLPYFIFPSLVGQFAVGMLSALGVGVCCKNILRNKKGE